MARCRSCCGNRADLRTRLYFLSDNKSWGYPCAADVQQPDSKCVWSAFLLPRARCIGAPTLSCGLCSLTFSRWVSTLRGSTGDNSAGCSVRVFRKRGCETWDTSQVSSWKPSSSPWCLSVSVCVSVTGCEAPCVQTGHPSESLWLDHWQRLKHARASFG